MSPAENSPPLAIVGIGCLFPAGAKDLAAYWARILNRVDAVADVPPTRWRAEDYLHPDPKAPDRVYSARGAFLEPVPFDPAAFGIAPNNLEATDSSQLLALLVAQQALEDAGYHVGRGEAPLPSPPKRGRGAGGEGENAKPQAAPSPPTPLPSGERGAKEESAAPRPVDRSRVAVILGVTGTLELVIPLGARLGHPVWRRALREAGVEESKAEEVVQRIADSYVGWQESSFPGLLGNVVAGRVANRFDCGGTNCVVDAACASSLGAVHLAALELATGRADLVLTGGVDTFNDVFMYTCFSKTPALSPTGDSRPFDSSADGTVLGEGVGMVVLKRLEDARADGDRVYAVLRGIGSASDGRGNAVYAPRAEGQVQALRNAYALAGVSPATVELVEAHGTGTRVGDSTELAALTEVYGAACGFAETQPWCALGSVKSQIGHTKAAAGVAGLIKAAAALYHKVLPPTIKVRRPLDPLAAGDSPFYLNAEKRPWLPAAGHPRRAAVSAFGFGGSNFHAVLEEADPRKPSPDFDGEVQILPFAADGPAGLKARLRDFPADMPWDDLRARAGQARREWQPDAPCRLLLVVQRGGTDLSRLLALAGEFLDKHSGKTFFRSPEGVYFGSGGAAGKLAVLFPGQGAQYPGMLRDLACHFPPAHETLAEADRSFLASGAGFRLSDRIYPPSAFDDSGRAAQEEALRATEVAQPALGAVSLGAWRVLETFGVRADAFAGHSYGELTALCASGRLRPEDFHSLSALRGRLMADAGRSADPGAMLAVPSTQDEILGVLRAEGLDLVLANKNSPRQTVLSGPTLAIDRAAGAFTARGVQATRLRVAAAFHSPAVAGARGPFRTALAGVPFGPGGAPVYANSTAAPYPEDTESARDLLAGQLARPVEWVALVEALHAGGVRTFLEVGPGGRLTGLVDSTLQGRDHEAQALDGSSGRRGGAFDLACCLAFLAARGLAVRLDAWDPASPAPRAEGARPSFIVPVGGGNYVKPKPATARAPRPGTNGTATPKMSPPAPTPRPAAPDAKPDPAPARPPAPPPAADALAQALQVTRETMAALQKVQEQTAQLHRQFLEGQEAAQRTVHLLVEQQQRLLASTLGLPPPAPALPARHEALPPPALPAPAPVAAAPAEPAVPADPGPPPPAPPPEPATGVERVLLGVVSEKTGYPEEMLGLDMALDADLGIDSIKRVEILSALQERLPQAPAVRPEHLGGLHTLRDVADFLSASPGATAEQPPAPAREDAPDQQQLQAVLLGVVSEKTGYPEEMLGLDMALDADLGIDSIKRVEILSALQERLPQAPAVRPEHLGGLHTLRDVADFLAGPPSGHEVVGQVSNLTRPAGQVGNPTYTPSGLERSVPHAVPLAGGARDVIRPPAGAEVWLAAEDPEPARHLASRLEGRGLRPRVTTCRGLRELPPPPALGGLVIVAPSRQAGDDFLKDALLGARHAGPALRAAGGRGGAFFVTVSRLDGSFGLAGLAPGPDPVGGGLAGLAKTAGQEWPEVSCRALDLAPDFPAPDAAAALAEELFFAGPAEVGLSPGGAFAVERVVHPLPAPAGEASLAPGDVVVVSGGARGVTAEVALELARQFRPTLVLLGRSPPPGPEPDWLAPLTAESEIKRELGLRLNGTSAPRLVGEEYRRVMARREVRHNLARLAGAGVRVEYRSVDVRDPEAVRALLAEVRRDLGPVRGLVHGAGVLADARIEDKTAEQFDAVYATKVGGLRALLAAVDLGDLRAVVLFSSSSARFGRAGQADYAIANEVLNKQAQLLARRLPRCRVLSLNWGPWDGGMVTPALKALFAREGVGLIGLGEGARHLAEELRSPDGSVEVVLLALAPARVEAPAPAVPASLPTAFERTVDLADHPVLESHVLDGRPVVPAALLAEWLAHGALHHNPGLGFHGFDDLRVLHGVILEGPPPAVRVSAGKAVRRGGIFVVPAELRGLRPGGGEVLHARAEIVLADRLPAAPEARPPLALAPYPHPPEEVYSRGMLFHGPLLRALERVEGCGEPGIAGLLRAAPAPAEWLRHPLRQRWLADPLVLDGSFQLMVLWTLALRGAPNLPCRLGSYRQWRRGFPASGARAVLAVTRAAELSASADVDYLDESGQLIARLEGYECVLDPSLRRAYRRNRLAVAVP